MRSDMKRERERENGIERVWKKMERERRSRRKKKKKKKERERRENKKTINTFIYFWGFGCVSEKVW